jgi:hypothetical protein
MWLWLLYKNVDVLHCPPPIEKRKVYGRGRRVANIEYCHV